MSEEKIKTKVQMGILKPANEVFEVIVDPKIVRRPIPRTSILESKERIKTSS